MITSTRGVHGRATENTLEEGENSFVYDATDLEDGKKYYFLAYVTDDLINATYSQYYYFTKETPQNP